MEAVGFVTRTTDVLLVVVCVQTLTSYVPNFMIYFVIFREGTWAFV
ncbi:MAG: hypothetical protein RI990_1693, partial [Planctomycetota bacterium]